VRAERFRDSLSAMFGRRLVGLAVFLAIFLAVGLSSRGLL
jgi:hypothetical protein